LCFPKAPGEAIKQHRKIAKGFKLLEHAFNALVRMLGNTPLLAALFQQKEPH